MNAIVRPSSTGSLAPLPEPRTPIAVRPGTMADIPFIDSLQKRHGKMVGFMPAMQLHGKINAGDVIIAEDQAGQPVGYCIGQDRYFKRDDVGVIYHLNVAPGAQRGFVGATLLKAMFDRAAYGCRLFCCWCAQDIEANRFWEAMGFVPLAYRAGSEKKARVHIFWQKRIRAGDEETPWWFPSQTTGGAIREDRLVLPIPPGKHWSDEMPVLLPREESGVRGQVAGSRQFHSLLSEVRDKGPRTKENGFVAKRGGVSKRKPVNQHGGLFFTPPTAPGTVKREPKPREKKPKRKNDPRLVAAARELKDRYLEHINRDGAAVLPAGKYDVSRAMAGPIGETMPLLLEDGGVRSDAA